MTVTGKIITMKINQLDLFSGIGGFHLGFERAGYKVTSFFSEIDKHAIAVYKHQFPKSTYVGSVTNVRGGDLPQIDLITFGSPCQDFSLAGKRKGMGGERSSLILEAIRLIGECRPRVFIWENVKGTFSSNNGEDFAAILQEFANIGGYRLEWQLLNTSWFLPQNRERIYLVGYSTTTKRNWRGVFPIGEGFGENDGKLKIYGNTNKGGQKGVIYDTEGVAGCLSATDYKQPKQIAVGTWRTHKDGEGFREVQSGDCPTIPARAREDGSGQPVIKIKSATSQGYEEATEGDTINLSNPNSETRRGRVGKGKAQTLETSCNQAVIEPIVYDDYNSKIRTDGNVGTLTGNVGSTSPRNGQKILEPNYNSKALNETIERNELTEGEPMALDLYNRSARNESPTLTQPEHNSLRLFDGYRIRRLTPIECERLQGFPDNHTSMGNYDGEIRPVSNTQRYKQCGNAVTVDVVQAVAEQCKPLFK